MMKKYLLNSFILFLALLSFNTAKAETTFFQEMLLTSDKMILTVIILLIIFFGIIFALLRMDKKLKMLEDQINNNK